MTRDTYDLFEDKPRGRFGDNEAASEQPERLEGSSRLHDLTLEFRMNKPLAIAVTDPAKPGSEWIWLPKSKIEFERKGAAVVVTLPEWLAIEKGLV